MRSIGLRAAAVALALAAIPGTPAKAQTFNGSATAATVNGDKITVDDWVGRMQNLRYQDFVLTVNPPRAKPMSAGQIALESLINSRVLLQYAGKVGLLPKEAELDADLANLKKQAHIAAALQSKLVTEAALREDVRIQRALYNVATVNERISSSEVALYYNAHLDQYSQPEFWTIGLIRVSGKATAEKVEAELKSGKVFADVAAQYSEEMESKKKGGELGTFAAGDPGIPAFIRDAVVKLKVGETTPALQSTLSGPAPAFFFVRLLAKKEKIQLPLEQIKVQVERAALFEKVGGGAKKMAEIRKDAKIEVSLPGYTELFKKQP
jgi:parvulin-like peptidyl-prolyl isomerase